MGICQPSEGATRAGRETHREEENLVPALCEFLCDAVHGLAWLCPVCAEVEDRDASEVGAEELLQVGRRLDAVVVGRGGHDGGCCTGRRASRSRVTERGQVKRLRWVTSPRFASLARHPGSPSACRTAETVL